MDALREEEKRASGEGAQRRRCRPSSMAFWSDAGGGRARAAEAVAVLPLVLLLMTGACDGVALNGAVGVSPRCHHTHAYGMLAADCHNVQLREIPQNLRTDVRAMDLTFNRIREVPVGAFNRYSSLELLYLDDNAISLVEEGALDPLTSLRVLSLSLNSLVTLPASIMQLPSLQRLVLARNPLSYESLSSVLSATRSDVPLEVLSLAECRLRALPPLHRLPRLRELNASGNPLESLRASQLAPLCSLRLLVLGDAHSVLDYCDSQLLHQWSEHDGLRVQPPEALECSGRAGATDPVRCANSTVAREAAALRAACGRTLDAQERAQQQRRLWTWVGGGIATAAALLALLGCCCWCCRRGGRKRRSASRRSSLAPDTRPLSDDREPSKLNNKVDEEEFHPRLKK